MASSRTSKTVRSQYGRRVDNLRLRRTMEGLSCGGRILLVDDQSRDLEILKLKMSMVLGPRVEIVTATSLRAAIDRFEDALGRFDVYIFNYVLKPTDTGLELFEQLSRYPRPDRVKSVLYSSRMSRELEQKARNIGFDMAVSTDDLDSMSTMEELLWQLVKPNVDWSASWRGLP